MSIHQRLGVLALERFVLSPVKKNIQESQKNLKRKHKVLLLWFV